MHARLRQLSDGLFPFRAAETRGDVLRFRLLEVFLLAHAVGWAWTWGAFIQTIPALVVPQGLARDIDLSFLVGSRLALVNAALITLCAVGALFARWARACLPLLLLLLHMQFAARHCLGKVAHGSHYVGFGLSSLALAAWCMSSASSRRRFALGTTQLLMGAAYVCAAISKLTARGVGWIDGRHLWLWIEEKRIDRLSEFGAAELNALQQLCLDHAPLATVFLGVGLVTELSGFLLWFRPTRSAITLALIGLHLGIYGSLGILFDTYLYQLAIVGLPLPALIDRALDRWWPSPRGATPSPALAASQPDVGFNPSYTGVRADVLSLVDGAPRAVLDVGCATGATGCYLQARYGSRVIGVELDAGMADVARRRLAGVHCVDLNKASLAGSLAEERFDLILFGDVLEHLIDPWAALAEARSLLAPGGVIIASLPNVGHYSTLISLVFQRQWPYRARGIHDRTHLRFFTRKNLIELYSGAGLCVLSEVRKLRLVEAPSRLNRLAKLLDFPPCRSYFTFQYIHRLGVAAPLGR